MAKALKYTSGYITESSSSDIIEGANMYPGYPPPSGTANRVQYFSALLGTGGANAGTTLININASGGEQSFYIGANANYDIHIQSIIIVISAIGLTHSKFGSINESNLTYGLKLQLLEDGNTTTIINGAKSIGRVLTEIKCSFFGSGTVVNTIPNFSANYDAAIIQSNVSDILPYGFRIGRGNSDKLEAIIHDNYSGIGDFYIRAIGFKNIPEA